MSAAVNLGILDAETVDNSISSRLILAWRQYKEWIWQERVTRGNKRLFEELEKLVESLPAI
jgi:hypothetical protein